MSAARNGLSTGMCFNCGKTKRTPYRFSVLVGTIFENTNVKLDVWFKVLWTILQSKKGISSRQIRRMFFGEHSSLHTAWYVGHRLRAGLQDDGFKKLMGIVEVDETYIGGRIAIAIVRRSPASNGKLKGLTSSATRSATARSA